MFVWKAERNFFKEQTHTHGVCLRQYERNHLSVMGRNSGVCIGIFTDVLAGYARSASLGTPAPFWLIDTAKAGFILKHDTYGLVANTYQSLDSLRYFFYKPPALPALLWDGGGAASLFASCAYPTFCRSCCLVLPDPTPIHTPGVYLKR